MNPYKFSKESNMQEWLSERFNAGETLYELIINDEEFLEYEPASITSKKIFESFSNSLKSLDVTSVVSENINISLDKSDSLKPDFILYAAETESIVIVEIKNSGHATREGGTEIGAYASEIKSYIPFISDGDIVNVIISPEWPTLIKHHIFHEIFWSNRNIICLEPIEVEGAIKLRIKDVSLIDDENVALKIGNLHLGGFHICLYDNELYGNNPDRNRLDSNIEQMKTAINAMAIKGNSQRTHGFAFLWKDNWEMSLAPYMITVANFAPYKSIERLFHDESIELNDIVYEFVNIIKDYDPMGHGQSLSSITDAGEAFLNSFCSPRPEGFHTWDVLKENMLGRSDLISFHAWGVFGEIFSEALLKEYEEGNLETKSDDPHLGLSVLDELVLEDYNFIDLSYVDFVDDEEE